MGFPQPGYRDAAQKPEAQSLSVLHVAGTHRFCGFASIVFSESVPQRHTVPGAQSTSSSHSSYAHHVAATLHKLRTHRPPGCSEQSVFVRHVMSRGLAQARTDERSGSEAGAHARASDR